MFGSLKKIFFYALGKVGVFIVDTLLFTSRIDVIGEEKVKHFLKSERFIQASWHGRLILFFIACKRGRGDAVMTSRSKDGAPAAQMQVCGGCVPFRGSSHRGGRDALTKMIEYMKTYEKPAMLSIDGPTGPIYKAKPGVIKLASETGFPIIPISFSGKRVVTFRSWDRCMMPKPFTKCAVIYGNPIHVPSNLSELDMKKYFGMVEDELMRITREVDAVFGHNTNEKPPKRKRRKKRARK